MKYTIVIPCYRSALTIERVVTLTMKEFQHIEGDVEFVLVNDASPDGGETFKKIQELAENYDNVFGVDLAKNAGQHNALMAGLNYADGDYIISMDDDMQTHPSQLHKLIDEIRKGYDVVYAYYPEKKHGFFRNFGSKFNSWTVRVLIGKPKTLKTSSFWIIKKFVRDSIIQYQNPYAYMQGLFLRTTGNIQCIPVEHFAREVGTSNYTLKAMLKLWSNVIGFSVIPLRFASAMGAGLALIGFVGALAIVIRKILFQISIAGWASTMVCICFFSGVILMFMGLIGEYIGRMFLSSNHQPQYVVRQVAKKSKEE